MDEDCHEMSNAVEKMADSEEDEPIKELFKVQGKRKAKKIKIVAYSDQSQDTGVKKMNTEDDDFCDMDDTLANLRRKLRNPKKAGQSTLSANINMENNEVGKSRQSIGGVAKVDVPSNSSDCNRMSRSTGNADESSREAISGNSPLISLASRFPSCAPVCSDDEVNGASHKSFIMDHEGSCAEDIGSLADVETKGRSVGQRAGRTVKKHRHGDMAYDGDVDWEVLMQSQEFFNNQISDKQRDKILSSSVASDSENGKAAAVKVGLKAHGVGPFEKIKFKEVLKRKGGLQEYLECRNYILSVWNKDVTHVLQLKTFGVSQTPIIGEDSGASLIRDVYTFLDQFGYINFGVLTEKKTIENCIKQEESEKSAEDSSLSTVQAENGVSSCHKREKISETCIGENIGDGLPDGMCMGMANHVQVKLKTINSVPKCSSEGLPSDQQQIPEPNPVEDHPESRPDSLPSTLVSNHTINGSASDFINCESVHENCSVPTKNIIVVGAGPAGLTAARHLQRQGFSVTVLEARSRIGGRVYTDRKSLSVPVDLGASIITGVEADVAGERRPDPSSLLCSQLGLELTVLKSECPLYDTVTGQKVPADLDDALEAEYNSLLDDMVMLAAEKGEHAEEMSLEDGLEYGLRTRLSHSDYGKPHVEKVRDVSVTSEGLSTDQENTNTLGCISETMSPLERRVMDWHFAHLEYGCAALLKDVSLPHWNQDDVYGGFGGAHCMIKGGYSKVVEALGEGICIHLNHGVAEICYQSVESDKNNGPQKIVKVTTLNGKEFSGDAVLVTVPLGCLKAETIKFSPSLPMWKCQSIKRLGFGVLNKVVIEFPEVFWDDTIDYFGATADDTEQRGWCFMFWNLKKTVGAPVLIALVVGKAAINGHDVNSYDHVKHALIVLRKLFGDDKVPDPVASVVTDWGRDPHSFGAYSYVAVGSSGEDYDILARPVENCVFFAGEATCKEHPDTVGGAIMSGLREAVRIINILNIGTDCIAEAETMETARRKLDIRRSEVRDIINQLDAAEFCSDLFNQSSDGSKVSTWESMLKDMFFNAQTLAGRLCLAKELVNLPVEFLRTFMSTKDGLSILNSWILDSMGKDGTQLLRRCVRLLLLVSNDLLAVRLSGIGKTIKEKVCVHTSRDIRSIASQLVSVWVDLFRKEKAKRGSLKNSGNSSTVRKPPTGPLHAEGKGNTRVPESGKPDSMEEENIPMSEEERAALEAAEAARAAAISAAKAYGLLQKGSVKAPKILSFHKFAMQDQHTYADASDSRKNWHGALGKHDFVSDIDSWNSRVRDWAFDSSATAVDQGSSKMLTSDHSQQNGVNHEHSGESTVLDSSMWTKAWVESSGGIKDHNAIERWQCQAAAASSGFLHEPIHGKHEDDSSMSSKSYKQKQDPSIIESSASESMRRKKSKGNHHGSGAESIKHAVVDYVASLLMPLYRARKIDREGYKSIMKKASTKVVEQATDSEKAMSISEFLDSRRKSKIRAFVDILIERHMASAAKTSDNT